MVDSFVQVPPDSTGKKVQSFQNTVGVNVVDAEGHVQVDSTGVAVPPGTAASPVRTDPTGTTTQPVSDAGGSITVDAPVGTPVRVDPTGTTTQPVSGTVTANQGAAGTAWPITDNAGSVTVDAPVATPVAVRNSDGAAFIEVRGGDVAHDAVDSGNPVKLGGKASLNEPTAVADADRVNAWLDQFGRLVTVDGHANPEAPVPVNGSAAGVSVIVAPGAGVSLHIKKGSLHNRAATETIVSLREGAAGTIRFTANLAPDGGGTLFDFGARGWKLPANTALVADIGQASVDVNITDYYIAA